MSKIMESLKNFLEVTASLFWAELDLDIKEQKINLKGKRETNILFKIVYEEEMKSRRKLTSNKKTRGAKGND